MPQPLGLLKLLTARSGQTHSLQQGVREGGYPPCPQGHLGECICSRVPGLAPHLTLVSPCQPGTVGMGSVGSCSPELLMQLGVVHQGSPHRGLSTLGSSQAQN